MSLAENRTFELWQNKYFNKIKLSPYIENNQVVGEPRGFISAGFY
jgi:hypothetical protein